MSDINSVGIARLEENLKSIQNGMDKADGSRRELHIQIHDMDKKLDGLNYRLGDVEKKLSEVTPTINEFVIIKNRVQGAGNLGKILWIIGGFVLAVASWAVGIFQNLGTLK